MDVLYVEKTEMVLTDVTVTPYQTYNITCDDLIEILTGSTVRKSFFGLIKKPTRYISFRTTQNQTYYLYELDIGAELYDEYLQKVADFAKRNRISMKEAGGASKDDWKL